MKMYVNMKKCMLILNRMDHGGYGCAKRIKCEEEREKEHEEGRRARKHMRKVPLRENVNKKKKRGGTSTTISMEGGGPGILGTNDTPPPPTIISRPLNPWCAFAPVGRRHPKLDSEALFAIDL
jgi:hypothetical protein